MPVLMLVAAIVILAGVVVVASGRGGEMAPEYPDYPPLDLGPVTAADVALLRPPSAAWGYNMSVTDAALETIAQAVTERDIKISALQQEVSDLRAELSQDWTGRSGAEGPAADPAVRAERPEEGPGSTQPVWPLDEDGAAADTQTAGPPWAEPEPAGPQMAESAESEAAAAEAALHGAPSHEAAGHEAPSDQAAGHAAGHHPARDDPDGQTSWDEPHQTLVWGAAHQRAKASRLQEQSRAPQDKPSQDAPSRDEPSRDEPSRDEPSRDEPSRDEPSGDSPGQDMPGPDVPEPASADQWAEVPAPSHYEDARQPAQAEQDRE